MAEAEPNFTNQNVSLVIQVVENMNFFLVTFGKSISGFPDDLQTNSQEVRGQRQFLSGSREGRNPVIYGISVFQTERTLPVLWRTALSRKNSRF